MLAVKDLATIGGACGITTVTGIFMQLINGFREAREAHELRQHELTKILLSKSYADVNHARDMVTEKDKTGNFWQGSFIGWTRRILAWVPLLFMGALCVASVTGTPINLIYPVTHHFLWFHWQTHTVYTVRGAVMTPYMRTYCDMVLGYYMGHYNLKAFK